MSGISRRRCGRCSAISTADPEVRMTIAERRARFRALHEHDGIFVMPNPWDVGSARLLTGLGCPTGVVS